jgi:hypothetical protein
MKKYLAICITASVIVAATVTHVTIRSNYNATWPFIFFVWGYSAIVVISVLSTVFAWRKLSKPGISAEIRSCIFYRHILAIVLYLVLNFYIYISSIVAFSKNADPKAYAKWSFAFKILFYLQGFAMPLMRCTEKAFIVLIKRRIKQNLYVLTFGLWRLEKELAESLDDRLIYLRLDSDL